MRQIAAKRDKNEPAIVKALKDKGAVVQPLSSGGVPDLLVGYRGINLLFEVKSDTGKLTDDQEKWHTGWKGQKCVVRTAEEALIYLYAIDYLIRS